MQPDEYLIDPNIEAEKIRKDKEKRIQKKIEKKRALLQKKKSEKKHQKRCLKCGSREHLLENCTQVASQEAVQQAGGFCFKCGSTEHSHKECQEQEYKLALCFYCGKKGHIVRDCPQN